MCELIERVPSNNWLCRHFVQQIGDWFWLGRVCTIPQHVAIQAASIHWFRLLSPNCLAETKSNIFIECIDDRVYTTDCSTWYTHTNKNLQKSRSIHSWPSPAPRFCPSSNASWGQTCCPVLQGSGKVQVKACPTRQAWQCLIGGHWVISEIHSINL